MLAPQLVPLRVVFLGPPGAGKGTQAAALSRRLGIPHLSTGDLLRSAVADRTPLGREAEGHMRAGRLVPDDLVLRILRERLDRPDAQAGFILDGYPRTLEQADELDKLVPVSLVVWFEADAKLLTARLAGRRVCPVCQRVYNVQTNPARTPGECDDGHGPLVQRPDDLPEAIAERLRVYDRKTAPLLDRYRATGLLRTVDASGVPKEVEARLAQLLGNPGSR